MDSSPLTHLPQDTLHLIFSHLPLRQIFICRSLSTFFNETLTSPSFTNLISLSKPPLHLIALRHRHVSPQPYLHVFDPDLRQWLRFPFDFLPFRSAIPVASSPGLVYLWAESNTESGTKSLVICNPLTRRYKVLPQLGSAWSRHGTILVGLGGRVLVLTELAALYLSGSNLGVGFDSWLKFSSNLASKPRSPILVGDTVFALCDTGSPWRSQWKLFSCTVPEHGSLQRWSWNWNRLEKDEWRDVFDILKRPRLVRGEGNQVLMVGGLKSSYSLNASCSTILILRLDLGTMEWDEAGRMPHDMFLTFQESSKFKVFGGGNLVCFSGRRVRRLAMWEASSALGHWRWVEGAPGYGDGLVRGFVFEARLTTGLDI
ncbi:hypothetical protein GIB67_036106 [Kingdonia uniflora]|uniref:F-box domain-containing protein n=1 Tax=Kingdonia uniflora TaxID=39325 RepID=A0A7J7N934_9MAGN|nr:hypothetical protein GIB67_036106 [Kingdonia uniflora]